MDRFDDLYDDLCVTMQRYANLKLAGLLADNPTLQYFDWDTASEANELPDTDLLGPSGLGFTDEGKTFDLIFSFGVSTVNDPNLFRLRKLASKIYKDFRPDAVLDIYSHDDGVVYSWAKVVGPTVITPIQRALTRPLQFITVNAVLDPFAPYR